MTHPPSHWKAMWAGTGDEPPVLCHKLDRVQSWQGQSACQEKERLRPLPVCWWAHTQTGTDHTSRRLGARKARDPQGKLRALPPAGNDTSGQSLGALADNWSQAKGKTNWQGRLRMAREAWSQRNEQTASLLSLASSAKRTQRPASIAAWEERGLATHLLPVLDLPARAAFAECSRATRVARVRESERGLYMRYLTTSAVHATMHIRGSGGSNRCRSERAFATPGAVPVTLALIANPRRGGVFKTRTPKDVINCKARIKRLLIRTAVDL